MHPEPGTAQDTGDGIVIRRGKSPEGAMRSALSVRATNAGTRAAIKQISALVDRTTANPDDIDRMEIALAEVLNNIVEHAYSGRNDGIIEVTIDSVPPGLHFTISDDGAEMPAGRLPGGNTAKTDLEPHQQAEGGYGLHLIRSVARKLRYERVGNHNQLSFKVVLGTE